MRKYLITHYNDGRGGAGNVLFGGAPQNAETAMHALLLGITELRPGQHVDLRIWDRNPAGDPDTAILTSEDYHGQCVTADPVE